jgi:hypothetical protein
VLRNNVDNVVKWLIVLAIIGVIISIVMIATTGGDSTLVHDTDVSPERGQTFISDEEMSHRMEGPAHYVIPEDGMYQEVRVDIVCAPALGGQGHLLAVARTPGSVTPVSITEVGGC